MKSNIFKKLSNNNLARNVLIVASGTAAAQIIALILMPIITRLYGPESYGKLGVFITVITILTPISTMALPSAIVLPEKDSESRAIARLSLIIALLVSTILSLVFIAANDLLVNLSTFQNLGNLIWFLPLALLFTSCQDVYTQWIIRKKEFKDLSKVSVSHSLLNYGTQALIGFKYPFTYILIAIHTIGIFVRALMLYYFSKDIRSTSLKSDRNSKPSALRILRKYYDFPMYRAPEMLLSAISQGMPVILLSTYFSLTIAGFYTLTRTVLAIPINLLGSSIQSVFYPHFNEAVLNNSKTTSLLMKPTLTLLYVGLVPLVLTIFFAPFAFSLVFGDEWYEAGKYAQWLSIWFLFTLVSRPSISAIPVFKLQGWLLIFELISTIVKILALFIGYYYFNNPIVAISLFSITGSLAFLILILKVFKHAATLDNKIK
ncbi:oligosaccharide flippase family protein [Psychrobacter raelei]|uniref:Oligosaccharide flippase family protein n=1 Tax=Psychrobacter raelei TaxID=2565531 RepID=A0AAT9PF88_9GAMM